MNILITNYNAQKSLWPRTGRHILAQYDDNQVVVYQAYKPSIGNFAASNGFFGGEFSYTRMSWCKPNFLWMMYRSGWGTKEGQEVTLAIHLKREFFESILSQAVPSSYDPQIYVDKAAWSTAVESSEVRLQWDPDHAPSGTPLERRAIQLGLRGLVLREYGREAIMQIEDISAFVAEQRSHVGSKELLVPAERIYRPADAEVAARLRLSK